MADGTGRGELLSIWFFVGIITLLHGLVLAPYGAWAWATGAEAPTVLHRLHPTFWWGLLLTALGAFYTVKYKPRRGDASRA